MKAISTCLVLLALLFTTAKAQCLIDSSQTQPGLHPDSLVNATVNQFYSQDITFVMITDTLGLSISNFNISALNGLPLGMQWVCNQSANGCNYDPAQSIFGCVRIFGTPVLAGTYPLSVTVVASVFLIGNQSFTFNTSLIVNPAVISNSGFSMTNALGCAPLSVNFTNNLPAADYYKWNFGNGDSSMLENPAPVVYASPGDYIVTQISIEDTVPSYYLTTIKIDSIPNNAGIVDVPDVYILVKNQAGTTVFDSHPSLTNTNPPFTFSPQGLKLNNETYSVFVWDEDNGISAPDDFLGSISFSGNGASDTAYATILSVSGRLKLIYTIQKISPLQNIAVDTVHVYPSAIAPIPTSSGALTICDGDTVFLNSNYIGNQQWFRNNNLLVGNSSAILPVSNDGNYFVVVSNTFGCSDSSSILQVRVNALPPYPNFSVNGNVLTASVSGTYQYQWYFNDTLILGANSISHTALQSGNYRLQLTDSNGCTRKSFPINVLITSINKVTSEFEVSLLPNPCRSEFMVKFENQKLAWISITISDIIGNLLVNESILAPPADFQRNFLVNDWKKGIYFVEIKSPNSTHFKKLVIE